MNTLLQATIPHYEKAPHSIWNSYALVITLDQRVA